MTGFGCRANKETYMIENQDLIFGPTSETGYPEFIELSECITKTGCGGANDVRDVDGRIYPDREKHEICPVRIIILYQEKKTEKQKILHFHFFSVKQSAHNNPEKERFWYTKLSAFICFYSSSIITYCFVSEMCPCSNA